MIPMELLSSFKMKPFVIRRTIQRIFLYIKIFATKILNIVCFLNYSIELFYFYSTCRLSQLDSLINKSI